MVWDIISLWDGVLHQKGSTFAQKNFRYSSNPNIFGICSEAMNNTIPAKNPVKTVFDMNLTINPNLKVHEINTKYWLLQLSVI